MAFVYHQFVFSVIGAACDKEVYVVTGQEWTRPAPEKYVTSSSQWYLDGRKNTSKTTVAQGRKVRVIVDHRYEDYKSQRYVHFLGYFCDLTKWYDFTSINWGNTASKVKIKYWCKNSLQNKQFVTHRSSGCELWASFWSGFPRRRTRSGPARRRWLPPRGSPRPCPPAGSPPWSAGAPKTRVHTWESFTMEGVDFRNLVFSEPPDMRQWFTLRDYTNTTVGNVWSK